MTSQDQQSGNRETGIIRVVKWAEQLPWEQAKVRVGGAIAVAAAALVIGIIMFSTASPHISACNEVYVATGQTVGTNCMAWNLTRYLGFFLAVGGGLFAVVLGIVLAVKARDESRKPGAR